MTIDRTRKRELPRLAVFALRGLTVLVTAALLAADLRWLHEKWYLPAHREEWLGEYRWLREQIQTRYPSLEWTVVEGRLDLYRLDLRTTSLLEQANTQEDAQRILRDFVRAFHDGHLALKRPGKRAEFEGLPYDVTLSGSTAGKKACVLLAYEESDEADFDLDFGGVAPFHPLLDDNPFRAGFLRVDGRKVGLLRIPSFDPRDYGNTCASEWERFRASLSTTCESACEEDFWSAMIERLLDDLGTRIRQMSDAGAELLIVDVTGNPGGYGRLLETATTLLAGRELPAPGIAVVANKETIRDLEHERKRLERALVQCPAPSAPRRELEAAYRDLDAVIAEAGVPCDRSNVWTDWGARPGCPSLVPYRVPDDRIKAELASASARHGAARTIERPSPSARARWRGRLVVLTNRHTGSAAELLAGILKDYAGATILGQRTSGCGGGWIFGLSWWTLEHSGLEFYMPDHESYRRDGSSYRAGVDSDVLVRLDPREDSASKAEWLVEALRPLAGGHERQR